MKEESKKNSKKENSLEKDNDSNFPVIDIIVSNTYLKLVYYHDILRYGFMNMSTLPDSQAIVVPNALYIVWIENGRLTSQDEYQHIIVGDLNNQLHIYTYQIPIKPRYGRDFDRLFINRLPLSFQYCGSISLNSTVLSVTSLDYNHDNIPEIVICTQKGVYIYTISKDYIIQLLSANKEFVE